MKFRIKLDEVMASGALLLGRVTYEGFAEAWPSRTGDFADKFNNMEKFVVSTTLDEPEWNNSTVIRGNIHDLVDEYRLMVFPVVLGSGKRLFGDSGGATPLRLVDTKPAGEVVILTLQPK